jgi:hypothetical protein
VNNAIQKAPEARPGHVLDRIGTAYGLKGEGEVVGVLQRTVFQGFEPVDIVAALILADQAGLNPFNAEVYLIKSGGKVRPYVSVDGFSTIMHRTGVVTGLKFNWGPDITHTFDYDKWEGASGNRKKVKAKHKATAPEWCEVVMKIRNWDEPLELREYFLECWRPTEPWMTMPRRQLRHKAYRQGVRISCKPGGVYLPDIDDVTELPAQFEDVSDVVNTAPGSAGLLERLGDGDSDNHPVVGNDPQHDLDPVAPDEGEGGDAPSRPSPEAHQAKPFGAVVTDKSAGVKIRWDEKTECWMKKDPGS